MSQQTEENPKSSEEQESQSEKNAQLVSVSEAIRYRKRAQIAEQKSEELAEQLSQSKTQISQMNEKLQSAVNDSRLITDLAAAGASDIETAVLIAKARLENDPAAEISEVITEIKKQKSHLFITDNLNLNLKTPGRTSGAKEKMPNASGPLARAAKKAVATGSRADLQEYLRLRRNFV